MSQHTGDPPKEVSAMLYVVRWTYVLGVLCALVAVVWRGLMTLGYALPQRIILGQTVYDMSFYKGALLLLVLSIASANYADYVERRSARTVR